ncbi:MAG: glycosyltransferase family 87 protein, partial [Candidatus Rokuibacteriota bacterium]
VRGAIPPRPLAPARAAPAQAGAAGGDVPPALFGRRWRYLAALGASVLLLVLMTGGARHAFEPETYPLTSEWRGLTVPTWRTFNPTLGALTAWLTWRSVDAGDFYPIYRAALRQRYGQNQMYYPNGLKRRLAAFVYTPFAALLVSPLVLLDLTEAQAADVVSVVNHLLAIAALIMLLRVLSHERPLAVGDVVLAVLHYLAFYPLARALHLTQATVWIFFFLVLSAFLLQRRWWFGAGLALAVGVSIKPHLIVAVPVLWLVPGFPRRVIVGCVVGLGVTTVSSVIYAGVENCRAFLFSALPTLSAGYTYFRDQSVGGLLRRLASIQDPVIFTLAPSVTWARTISTLMGVAILGLTLLACRRSFRSHPRGADLLCFGAALTAAVLISPVLWEHHFTVLLIPFAVAAGWLRLSGDARPRGAGVALLASFVLVGVYVETRYFSGFPLALLSGFQFYGGLLLLSTLAVFLGSAGPGSRAGQTSR